MYTFLNYDEDQGYFKWENSLFCVTEIPLNIITHSVIIKFSCNTTICNSWRKTIASFVQYNCLLLYYEYFITFYIISPDMFLVPWNGIFSSAIFRLLMTVLCNIEKSLAITCRVTQDVIRSFTRTTTVCYSFLCCYVIIYII